MCVYTISRLSISLSAAFVFFTCSSEASNDPEVNITLQSVDFKGTGNHQLRKQGADSWDNDKYEDEGNTSINAPEWQAAASDGTGGVNDPVCYTRLSTPMMDAVISVTSEADITLNGTLKVKIGETEIYSDSIELSDGVNNWSKVSVRKRRLKPAESRE